MKRIFWFYLIVCCRLIFADTGTAISNQVTLDTANPVVVALSPGGSLYQSGSNINIAWSANDNHPQTMPIQIEWRQTLSEGWQSVSTSEQNDGTYHWTAPTAYTEQAQVQIIMTDVFGNMGTCFSPSFVIVPGSDNSSSSAIILDTGNPVIALSCPATDSIFVTGDSIPILWNTTETNLQANTLSIDWQSNSTSDWVSIALNEADDGYYLWTTPDDTTDVARVRLSTIDAFGNIGSVVSEAFTITEPYADFIASETTGDVPLFVQFTDLSKGNVVAWQWDFDNDGVIDSREQSPNWVYVFPWQYSVSLTVMFADEQRRSSRFESDTELKTNYIQPVINTANLHIVTNGGVIQTAIDSAQNGDIILVEDGIYYENLQIVGKEITLASYYFMDGDSLHTDNTIIDGSQNRNRYEGSVIAIKPGTNPNLSSHIIGFTITHGRGRSITLNQGGIPITKIVGGGIYVESNHPILTRNKIVENDADDEGGGSYAFQSLPNLGGYVGIGRVNGGANIFRDNHADIGKDIYIDGTSIRDEIKAENCSFSVFAMQDTTVSDYWATSSARIDYSGGYGQRQAITTDIWVATDGNNENIGTTPNSPLLTIDHALSLAYGSQNNPLTIHLAPGIYSPSNTGERFPLQMVSWVSLQGSGEDETFLSAEATVDMPNRVLNIDKVTGCQIRDLTITGGVVTADKGINGAGIAMLDSDALLSEVTGMDFSAYGDGGCLYVLNSQITCDSLNFYNNTATSNGGAICIQTSTANISASTLAQNSAHLGGGIYASESLLEIDNVQITDNTTTGSQRKGGGLYLAFSDNSLVESSVIKGNNADIGAGLYLQNATNFQINENRIVNNLQSIASFSNGGGGLYWNNACSGLLENNLIANNTAYQGGAGFGMSVLDFQNNTIVNNRANYRGGAFYLNACSPSFRNSILWGNAAASGGNQFWMQTNSSDPEIRYCDIQGGTAAFGLSTGSFTGIFQNNLNTNPLFSSPSSGVGVNYDALTADFSLHESSPCVNAGDPASDLTAMNYDLVGHNRLSGDFIDIGAYEYQFAVLSLDSPQNVSISIENEQLSLHWDGVSDANSYRIFASDLPYGDFEDELLISSGILSLNGNRYTWTTPVVGLPKQFYRVQASSAVIRDLTDRK